MNMFKFFLQTNVDINKNDNAISIINKIICTCNWIQVTELSVSFDITVLSSWKLLTNI